MKTSIPAVLSTFAISRSDHVQRILDICAADPHHDDLAADVAAASARLRRVKDNCHLSEHAEIG